MITYLIVEDEPIAAEKLQVLVRKLKPAWQLLNRVDTIEKAVEEIKNKTPDLLFLDIHLADGNSFEIFNRVEVTCPIIFTTAFDQYAIPAFKQNSIDYLLKPISKPDLEAAIIKFEKTSLHQSIDIQALIASIKTPKAEYQKRFMVFHSNKIKTIPVEEVAYFFSESKHCFLVHHSGEQYIIDSSLDKLEQHLDPKVFFRINRQFIIGIESITEMEPYSKSRVFVRLNPPSNKESVVSVERSGKFKAWLSI